MRPATQFDNSVTYEFSSDVEAEKVAAQYNQNSDDNNFAVAKRTLVAFMGQKFKKAAIAEFSGGGEIDSFGRKRDR